MPLEAELLSNGENVIEYVFDIQRPKEENQDAMRDLQIQVVVLCIEDSVASQWP